MRCFKMDHAYGKQGGMVHCSVATSVLGFAACCIVAEDDMLCRQVRTPVWQPVSTGATEGQWHVLCQHGS